MNNIYNNILDTIGNTPIVKINNLGPKDVNLFVKVESFNPGGSVKDRLALGVIEAAEKSGELKPGQTIVEATSGNTGIALAIVCAQKGYPLVVVMAENFSVERRKLIRFLGAKVVLTPASEKGSGMLAKAVELSEKHGWWLPKQFENPANKEVHRTTTAQEILRDFSEIGLDYFVSGYGTGGTISGVTTGLKEADNKINTIVCEPDNAQILASGIPQKRDDSGQHSESHPSFRPHLMQGWSPDFLPKLTEQTANNGLIDSYIGIDGNHAIQCAKDLAQKEGIFVGISAGATFSGALEVAKTAPKGANILCMLPDTGERYMTTALFEGIAAEMSDEEISISKSTAKYRFDVAAPAPVDEIIPKPEASAVTELQQIISNKDAPIVMFSLEWCEFCWSVRKALTKAGIAFKSIDLDSVKYQQDDRGGKLRLALRNHTTLNTFPQIFIGGEFIGGCTELLDGIKDHSVLNKIDSIGINRDSKADFDPYEFLPKWLHPR